jgi:phosphatidylglycerol:prolipoprotein diacylglycerol transferase
MPSSFAIEIDIDPVIVQLGPVALRWYSVAIMLGVIVGTALAARLATRRGIAPDHVYSAALWVVIAGIVGARLAHVLDRFDYYRASPGRILALYEGGLAIWGGLVAGALAGWVYARRTGLSFWRLADASTCGVLLGLAIGRVGSIVNGDVAGKVTSGFGFIYTNPNVAGLLPKPDYFNTPTQPYALYELLWDLAVFGVLLWLAPRLTLDGTLFLCGVVLYSIGRFVLSFLRAEEPFLFGLQQAQVFALVAMVVAVYLYLYLRGRRGRLQRSESSPRPTPAGA